MINELLENKTARERANIKATELAKLNFVGEHINELYGIKVEIQSLEKIEDGIEIFARAWKGGKQLGFGRDGTVDLERFHIINPPILVPDVNGIIIRSYTDDKGNVKTRKLREDPLQATRTSLIQTIKLVGKEDTQIVPGSVGNTTTTVYPDADPETTSVDGRALRNVASETFATIRAGAGNDSSDVAVDTNSAYLSASGTTDQYAILIRGIFLFDTSSIPDTDSIDSATFSVWGTSKTNGFTTIDNTLHLCASTPASNTAIVNADYGQLGTTSFGSVTFANFDGTNTVYTNVTVNATGLSDISKTGITKFGVRTGTDITNTAPTWVSAAILTFQMIHADTAGTTSDPKLVVVHTAAVVKQPAFLLNFM